VIKDDEILIFYTGQDLPMYAAHLNHPQRGEVDRIMEGDRRGTAIGLATLRLDGFVSMEGYEPAGVLITRSFEFEGQSLEINARAPRGAVRIEILDELRQPLAGFEGENFDDCTGDEIHHAATWRGSPDVSRLQGRPVRLKFTLQNAALYAFQFIA